MECLNCGAPVLENGHCSDCGMNYKLLAKAYNTSNYYYNLGLDRASVRDLTGAIDALNLALKYNKQNINARNLLGLIHYEMGEIVLGLTQWVISSSYDAGEDNIDGRLRKRAGAHQRRRGGAVREREQRAAQAAHLHPHRQRDPAQRARVRRRPLAPQGAEPRRALGRERGAAHPGRGPEADLRALLPHGLGPHRRGAELRPGPRHREGRRPGPQGQHRRALLRRQGGVLRPPADRKNSIKPRGDLQSSFHLPPVQCES